MPLAISHDRDGAWLERLRERGGQKLHQGELAAVCPAPWDGDGVGCCVDRGDKLPGFRRASE